jgi:gamma-resorcylate decarboxylase
MVDKIALEEHFAVEETLMDSAGFVPEDHWSELKSRILDIHDGCLRLMDAHNIERMILSLNPPAVQAVANRERAAELARRANDALGAEITRRPNRFSGFAAGGLISYGADYAEQVRQAAGYIDRILKGAKPTDLPIQLPINYEMAINLKTATSLGLNIPPTLTRRRRPGNRMMMRFCCGA